MLMVRGRPISIVVMVSIALHSWLAFVIWLDATAIGATGVSAIHRYMGGSPLFLAGVLACVAMLAFIGVLSRHPWIALLLVPQQILLMMSAAGAIDAVWLAQFADGITRPRAFIAADQCYSVLIAGGHTIALIAHALRRVQ